MIIINPDCASCEAVKSYILGVADFARFEAVMTFMESLIGMNFIRYVGSNMQRIIMETIFLAGSSADWQSRQLPDSVFSSAHQMLLTLSNIHSLNNIQNFGNTPGEQATGNVANFLAGFFYSTLPEDCVCLKKAPQPSVLRLGRCVSLHAQSGFSSNCKDCLAIWTCLQMLCHQQRIILAFWKGCVPEHACCLLTLLKLQCLLPKQASPCLAAHCLITSP